jgi:hypothetical protein
MVSPDSDFEDLFLKIGDHMELDIFVQRNVRDVDFLIEEGDASIAIEHTRISQTEDAQIVHIVAQREPEGLQNSLSSLNMGPGSLLRDKIGIKQLATVVIQRCDQGQLIFGKG